MLVQLPCRLEFGATSASFSRHHCTYSYHFYLASVPGLFAVDSVVDEVYIFVSPCLNFFFKIFDLGQRLLLDNTVVVSLCSYVCEGAYCTPDVVGLSFFLNEG